MGSRVLVLGALGLACVLAAGGGAYLAVRQAHNEQPAYAASQQPVDHQLPGGTPAGLVSMPSASEDVSAAVPSSPPAAHVEGRAVSNPAPRSARPAPMERHEARHAAPSAAEEPAAVPAQVDSLPPASTPAQPQPITSAAVETPREREYVQVIIPSESVLGLQVQTAVSSETARVEDRVDARVTRDVRVDDRIAIPAGSKVEGSVVQVERGGKVKDRAHFAIRFHTLQLPDGTRTPLTAEALYREGPSPANKSAAKIGGAAVGGAILGAILGGGKGAAIGGSVGAAGGTAATMAGQREPALLAAGSIVNVRLMSPVTVTLER